MTFDNELYSRRLKKSIEDVIEGGDYTAFVIVHGDTYEEIEEFLKPYGNMIDKSYGREPDGTIRCQVWMAEPDEADDGTS